MDDFYAARRSFRRSWMFFAAFGFFFVLGFVMIFATKEPAALLVSLFGGVCLALLSFQVGAPGFGYELGDGYLALKNTFKKESIPLGEIASVALLDERAAHDFLYILQKPVVEATRNYDISLWWRTLKRNGEIFKFLSVSLVSTSTSAGTENNIVKFDVMADGSYLLIETKDGGRYLATPADAEGLYRALLARGVKASDSAAAAARQSAVSVPADSVLGDSAASDSGLRFVRKFGLISTLVFIPIVAVVIWMTAGDGRYPARTVPKAVAIKPAAPSPRNEAGGELVLEDGWQGDDALRLRVRPPFFAPPEYSEDEKVRYLRELAKSDASWSFASFVLKEYMEIRKLSPADIPRDAINQSLRDWALTLPIMTLSERFGSEGEFSDFSFEYRKSGLRSEARERIERLFPRKK